MNAENVGRYSGSGGVLSSTPLSADELAEATCLVCESRATTEVQVRAAAVQEFGSSVLLCDTCASLVRQQKADDLQARVVHIGSPVNTALAAELLKATTLR